MGKALKAEEISALLISLGFVEVASSSSVSGVEYALAGVHVYQTSDTNWALDSERAELSTRLASIPRGDGPIEQIALAVQVATECDDAPRG